jgi:hypothetical protein
MDGSELVSGVKDVYGGLGESGSTTSNLGRDRRRVLHEFRSDLAEGRPPIKSSRGGRVSDLTKTIESPTIVYGPGSVLNPVSRREMSTPGGGGDHGGAGEAPTRPKPPGNDVLVLETSDRQLAIVEMENNNWDGALLEKKLGATVEADAQGGGRQMMSFAWKRRMKTELLRSNPRYGGCWLAITL